MKKILFLVSIICSTALVAPHIKHHDLNNQDINVVFDLGGVLIETDGTAAFKELISHVGVVNFSLIAFLKLITMKNPFALDRMMFNYLNAHYPRIAGESLACDKNGNLLPQPMCDWLKGNELGSVILEDVLNRLNCYENNNDATLLKAIAHIIFDPATFIRTRKLIPGGVSFVRKCKEAGYKLYVLSNWDEESFELLQRKYPEFFNQFDGIIISGKARMLKPDHELFDHAFNKTWNLNLQRTVYLDDQPENLVAPSALGVTTISCNSKSSNRPDFKQVSKKFKSFLQTVNFFPRIIENLAKKQPNGIV